MIVTLIGSIAMALLVSALCSLLEAALLSITPSQVARIRRDDPQKGDLCRQLKYELENSLAVILICNTAAHTIGAAVAGSAFDNLCGARWLGWFSLAFTLVMIQYTELLPKSIGVRYNENVMRYAALPLHLLVIVMKPLIHLTRLLNRPFEPDKAAQTTPAEEISALAAMARSSQLISSRQERIINAVPRLSRRTAEQVMLPVENISFLSTNQSLSDAINWTGTDFHTRYPVCESGDPDRVIGYVNFKEVVSIYRSNPDRCSLADIIRPLSFAKPEESAAMLLERFISQHCHMAIVRASTGRTLGLVTLEDIVEELVGDLDDEFDPLPRTFYQQTDGHWVAGGGISLSQLGRDTGLPLPKRSEPVAVWFARMLKRQPRVGNTYRHGNVELTVRKVRRGRVLEFYIKRSTDHAK